MFNREQDFANAQTAFTNLVDKLLDPYNGSRVPHEVFEALLDTAKALVINAYWIEHRVEALEDAPGSIRYCWQDDTTSFYKTWTERHPNKTA